MVPALPGEFVPWLKENVTRSLCTARGELGASTRTYWVGRKVSFPLQVMKAYPSIFPCL